MPGRKPSWRAATAAWFALAFTPLLLASASARGQGVSRVAAYDGMPAADDQGFLHMPGTAAPGHLRSSFTLHNELTLGEFQDYNGQALGKTLVDLRNRIDFLAQVGLGDRLALALGVPIAVYQNGQALPGQALLNPQLRARYRLFGAASNEQGDRTDGPGLAIAGTLFLPLGDEDGYASEGWTRAEVFAIADFQVLGAGIGAKLGLRHRFDHFNIGHDVTPLESQPNFDLFAPIPLEHDYSGPALRMRDSLLYGIALKLPMPFWPPFSLLTELEGATQFTGGITHAITWLFGGRVHVGDWSAFATVGVGLQGLVASPDGTVSLGVRYSPAPADSDGDGISDGSDQCPFLPEDMDGFEDDDGCEDPDNDNDLIPDADDLCPNEEALEGQDADEDGCTDPAKR